MYIVVITIS